MKRTLAIVLLTLLWGTCVRGGGSRDFSGTNQYLAIPNSDDFDFSGDFSLATWVRLDTEAADMRLWYRYDGTSKDGFYLSYRTAPVDNFTFLVFINPTYDLVDSDDAVSTATWYHVVGVRTSGTLKIWVDGAEQSGSGTKAGAIDSSGHIWIGVDAGTNYDFDGQQAHMHAYDRALTGPEINQIMWCPGSIVDGLMAYLPLWGVSNPGYDLSDRANNANNTNTTESQDAPPIGLCVGSK